MHKKSGSNKMRMLTEGYNGWTSNFPVFQYINSHMITPTPEYTFKMTEKLRPTSDYNVCANLTK